MDGKIQICIKVLLDLEESGFVSGQRNEFGFRASFNNRLADIEKPVQEMNISHDSETSSLFNIHLMISALTVCLF